MTELADKTITLALGARRDERRWRNKTYTVEEFTNLFEYPERGPKDGFCFLQGETVDVQRLNKNMRRNYLIVQDHDNGETTEDIIARIEETGLAAIVYNTHSHLSTSSEIPQDKFDRYVKKFNLETQDLGDVAARYLREVKGYIADVTDTIGEVHLEHRAGGVKYVVEHAPMHKVRSIFFLAEPFEFAVAGVSQADRMDEWKRRHEGFAEITLGMTTDESTHDCARLMYTYRIPRDADPENYTSVLIPGRAVELVDFPEWQAPKTRAQEAKALLGEHDTNTRTSGEYQTPNLRRFLGDPRSKTFQAADWMGRHTEVRTERGDGKTEFECPHDALHTNAGDNADRGFFAVNADDSMAPPQHWFMGCQHATCKAHTGGDRAQYLDQACANFGVGDAMDLLEACTNKDARAEGEARLRASGITDVDAAIVAVHAMSTEAETAAVALAIVQAGGGAVTLDRRTNALAAALNVRKPIARQLINEAQRQNMTAEHDDNRVGVALPAPPRDPAAATEVCEHWPYSDQWACALAIFLRKNDENPTVFKTAGGPIVRLVDDDGKKRGETIVNGRVWKLELKRRVPFVTIDPDTGERTQLSAPPKEIVDDIEADSTIPWPYLERIVDVPVFAADGALLTSEGYNAGSRVYMKPTVECRALPDFIEAHHLDEALYWLTEPIIDFPFTDAFSGYDPEPIRDPEGRLDEDGHPLPNYNRGRSSRAHYVALLLQPFARALIDGPCPAFLIDKAAAGTGAGFLANILGFILYGYEIPINAIQQDQEAFQKEISSVLREGAPTIFFDNINFKLDSGALAAALTSGRWKSRLLGSNDVFEVPVKTTWLFATNNGSFTPELMRRIVPIRMNANCEHPATDRGPTYYKQADLSGWVKAHRKDLIWACHVLIRAWLEAGRPQGHGVLQSFNRWSYVIGGILENAGIEGFLENIPDYIEHRTDDEDTHKAFVEAVHAMLGTTAFTVAQAYEAAKGSTGRIDPDLGLGLRAGDESSERRALGQLMGRLNGRTYTIHGGDHIWTHVGKRDNRQVYQLTPIGDAA